MEQSYKEKYEQAIERLKQWDREHPCAGYVLSDRDKFIFPELAESEDEKIRKEIIDFLKLPHPQFVGKRDHEKWIAWLKKQDEQEKDKLEDAILDGYILDDDKYGLIAETIRYKHEKQAEQKLDKVEPKFKVGDTIKCKYDDRQFTIKSVDLDKGTYTYTQEGCGNDIDYADEDFELVEQKPAWSEEDKGIIEEVVSYLINYSNIVESKEDADRIEYLIDKIQDICPHQKQEWSEEDEQHIDSLLERLDALCRNKFGLTRFAISEDIDWLKSLRPQNRWKPSKEQMEALNWHIGNTSVGSWQYKATKELMADLKKLKEKV